MKIIGKDGRKKVSKCSSGCKIANVINIMMMIVMENKNSRDRVIHKKK